MSKGRKAHKAEGGRILFYCPGCQCHHGPLVDPAQKPCWEWNGSLDSPTFHPSILVRATVPLTDDEVDRIMAGEKIEPKPLVCHSFVRDGHIEYLADFSHHLAGQTVEIPDVDEPVWLSAGYSSGWFLSHARARQEYPNAGPP